MHSTYSIQGNANQEILGVHQRAACIREDMRKTEHMHHCGEQQSAS